MSLQDWHVFVGSEIGLLKGVDIGKKAFTNINSLNGLTKDEEITTMCWEDSSENKVYTGHRNQVVRSFDCETLAYTTVHDLQVGEGPLKGVCGFNNHIVTAVESGTVKVWNEDEEKEVEINTGGSLCRMTQNPFCLSQVATGGEENDLKIWDLQTPENAIFKAKNVRNDFLDLRVPVWITDIKFKSLDKVLTCTRHHQIRLYDTRSRQKRPVIDMEFEKYPLMSLSLAHNEHQVVVGSSRGRMALIDLRKKLLVHVFKGFAGSIRNVQCHPTLPLVASCGLDRFLRIHDLNRHKLLKKVYLKTRLNCLLFKTDFEASIDEEPIKKVEKTRAITAGEQEVEDIWNSMALVGDAKKLKKTSDEISRPVKKKKTEH